MMHAKLLGMAAVVAAGLGLATAASAAPLSPPSLGPEAAGAPIERVAGGCGPGFHPNPWGVCRPNWGPRPYWRRPVYGPYAYYGRPRPYYGGFYGPRPFF